MPEQPETFAMPPHEGLWLNDHQSVPPVEYPGPQHQTQPSRVGEWPRSDLVLSIKGELLSQKQILGHQPVAGPKRRPQELLKLGFKVSEPTVSRWLQRAPRSPDLCKRWLTFLRNHREAIAAMDFFTVPTLTFGVLYCFFVIGHGRRKILRCDVTRNPSALWIVQQMREAWPYATAQKFLLFDRDSKFGNDVISAAKNLGTEPVRTAFRSPWQNGTAERWVGSCRRDLLDHVSVLNERHLKRLMREYIRYYHEDRTHLGLAKDTPAGRAVARASANGSRIQSFARLGGLHHRYAVPASPTDSSYCQTVA